MARLIVWNLVTLDGCFEGTKKWQLDFHMKAWGPELEALSLEFGRKAGLLVFGRVTYEGMASHWTTAEDGPITRFMNALPKLCASRTLQRADWNNARVTADAVAELTRLKAGEEKDVYVFGSADLCHSLFEAGLVDELILCTVPVVLGAGTPFFNPGRSYDLALERSTALSNGCVVSTYVPKAA